ncbi:hypothetical protein SK128_025573 [Halocaridina rubra]|uniref:Uncharacterized protein n=1 Tax=Halocaridina rubra TaxID=373956 RepID=A0AAN8WXK4_HALRR
MDGYIPFADLNIRARKLLDITTKLAAKTRVLIWQLTKFRWFAHQHEKKYVKKYLKKYWEKIVALSRFDDGTTLLGTWLWRIFRKIGAWHWDSTFPFDLANIRECEKLNNANEFNHTMYNSMWWMCKDYFHSSFETNNNEMQMLLNLLCNRYDVDEEQNYCCSIDGEL